MSQKINPINFRLGLLQVWDTIFTQYGNKSTFSFINQRLHLKLYIKKLLNSHGLLLDSITAFFTKNTLFLFISFSQTSKQLAPVYNIKYLLVNTVGDLVKKTPKVFVFKKPFFLNSAELVTNYISYRLNNNLPIRVVLKEVYALVTKNLTNKKVLIVTNGIFKFKLNGLKIQLKGRLENSRNQMSKTTRFKKGCSSLPNLGVYTEYSQIDLYTKSGVLSLYICLFYKKI